MTILSDISGMVNAVKTKLQTNKWKVRTGTNPAYVYAATQQNLSMIAYLDAVNTQITQYLTHVNQYINTGDKDGYMDSPEVRQVMRQSSSEYVVQYNLSSYTSNIQKMQIVLGESISQNYFQQSYSLMSTFLQQINAEDAALPSATTNASNFTAVFNRLNIHLQNFRVEFDTKRNRSAQAFTIEREIYLKENQLGGFFGSTVQFVFSDTANYNVVKDSLQYMPYSNYRNNVDAWRYRLQQAPADKVNEVQDAIIVEVKNYTDSTFNYSNYTITELNKAGV